MEVDMSWKIGAISSIAFMILVAIAVGSALAGGGGFSNGDVVWAEWTSNGWYHGKVDKTCDAGWHVQFDDGDQKCCTGAQIVKDVPPDPSKVKVGSKVLAQWTNQKYYPGKVAAIAGGDYSINFDDGDKGKVKISQIRLKN
jgi:hypothetical protein